MQKYSNYNSHQCHHQEPHHPPHSSYYFVSGPEQQEEHRQQAAAAAAASHQHYHPAPFYSAAAAATPPNDSDVFDYRHLKHRQQHDEFSVTGVSREGRGPLKTKSKNAAASPHIDTNDNGNYWIGQEHNHHTAAPEEYQRPDKHVPADRRRHMNIFDKLTNPNLFTGIHKHRFDPSTGRGKGKEGRDVITKGGGHLGRGTVHVNRGRKVDWANSLRPIPTEDEALISLESGWR
eukprot:PhM_4_TR1174/c0_g1_i1/m.14207